MAHPLLDGAVRPREHKPHPEIFTWLGWCSWEQFKVNIDEALLLDVFDRIERSDVPVRYMLIDDGHLHQRNRQLVSFDPDAERFPRGFAPLIAHRQRADDGLADDRASDRPGVRWFGLWLNFNGYWQGLAGDGDWGDLAPHLAPIPNADDGRLLPRGDLLDAIAFHEAILGNARRAGFDFIKVDDQAQHLAMRRGSPHAVRAAANHSQALELVAARHMHGLINCMAHNMVCAFNARLSAVTRCSEDYKVNDAWRAKAHLHNSFANMLWLGPTVWGDHDMFHASDGLAARPMAIAKALSGGPIYLSDDPADFDMAVIAPLCFADGKLLRPLAPGAPTSDAVYASPFTDAVAYRTVAPLSGGAVAVGAFNLTEPTVPVRGELSASDYLDAAGLLDAAQAAAWSLPDEGLIHYDMQTHAAHRLTEPFAFAIEGLDARLDLLCPIRHGWAVIGQTDKYLAPAAVEVIDVEADTLIVRMDRPGPMTVWSESPVRARGYAVTPAGEHLWRVEVPTGLRPVVVRLAR